MPEILPDFFPESKEFEWIKEQDFLPKEILELEKERTLIQEQYNSKIKSLNERRNAIDQKYKFLNDLLIETEDKLVQAVCTYFKWLGFANVEAIDGNEDILREDIQILEDDKLFIIEVTRKSVVSSTMKSCSRQMPHRNMQTAIPYGTPPKRWRSNGTLSLQGGGCLPSPEKYRPTSTLSLSGSFARSSLFPKA